jgi:hypothetical protein
MQDDHRDRDDHRITAEKPESHVDLDELMDAVEDIEDPSEKTEDDRFMESMDYQNLPMLRRARAKLSVKMKDRRLDIFFRGRLTAMVGTLNLYLDPQLSYTWQEASFLAAKVAGRSVSHARNIRAWILTYLRTTRLPLSRYGRQNNSLLADEDFSQLIQLHLQSVAKDGYVQAQDVVNFVATPEMKEYLGRKSGITVQTARRWMKQLEWRYGRKKRGMYINGHERDDVVAYRKQFLARWSEYLKRMVVYDRDGNVAANPTGVDVVAGKKRLILVTHDESTFYANDRRSTKWTHASDSAEPERKGEGVSIMISDFLTPEWGHLVHEEDGK